MFEYFKKNVLLFGLIGIILILLFVIFQSKRDIKQLSNNVIGLQKEILASDSLRKLSDGNYTKLIDSFKSQKELLSELKVSNKDLYNRIKDNGEKITQLNQYFISFKSKLDSGFALVKDSNNYELTLFYPQKTDWFVNWNGLINRNNGKYLGNWNFGKLKFGVTVTQQKNGLWRTYVSGPDFLLLDSIRVEALMVDNPLKERNVEFLTGLGYRWNPFKNEKNLVFSGGLQWKNSNIILLDIATDNTISGKFIYKFKSYKQN